MIRLGQRATLSTFCTALKTRDIEVPPALRERLVEARRVVDGAAAGKAPVYGLNTGLGANLGHRIDPEDIEAFQLQILEGRAVAVGEPLAAPLGRAVLLARLIGVAQGHSGLSPGMFDHLCSVWRAGLEPQIPRYGSIGAADLTQNAVWALALLGNGRMGAGDQGEAASAALARAGLTPPALQPKDAMALINHGGVSVALAAKALSDMRTAFGMMRQAATLSFQGYGANPRIFAPEINALRRAPGQAEAAAWFLRATATSSEGRVQDALSFRLMAPMFGAAQDALDRSITVWEDELNGASDNPVVLGTDAMRSTPNFHAPALALALEQVSLAAAMLGQGAVMRMQRLMTADLSGLPRYLSAVGGASGGFVPLQKSAAALLADMRRHAMPVALDPAPVSDGVEDIACQTPLCAIKLADQAIPAQLLAGMEGLVASQAIDLRGTKAPELHRSIRALVPMLGQDRALQQDVDQVCTVLREVVNERWVGGE